MKKFFFILIVGLMAFVNANCQTEGTQYDQQGTLYGQYADFSYSFDAAGYFNWTMTVHEGAFTSCGLNEIEVELDDNTSSTHLGGMYESFPDADELTNGIYRSGRIYVGTSGTHMLEIFFHCDSVFDGGYSEKENHFYLWEDVTW